MPKLIPDRGEAERFLKTLDPAGQFTFQTFDDSPAKSKKLIRVLNGTRARYWTSLCNLNAQGAGIFVTINRTDLKGRKEKNIVGVRAVFADLDGSPLEPVLAGPLTPHITVESSPGRYHAYWLVNDLPLGEFRAVQQSIIAMFNSDPNVHDRPRVMRLPGFFHQKKEPFMTKVIDIKDHPRFTADEIRKAFPAKHVQPRKSSPLSATAPRGEPIPAHERNNTLTSEAGWLRKKGCDESELMEALRRANAERCNPPLSEQEVEGIAKSVCRYTPGLPISLQRARERIQALPIKKNPRVLLEEGNVVALAVIKTEDPPFWQETRGQAKGFIPVLERAVQKQCLRIVRGNEDRPGIGEVLSALGVPVPGGCEHLVVPETYTLDQSGVGILTVSKDGGVERHEVAPQITFISRRIIGVDSGDYQLEVQHYEPDGWRGITAPRADFFDSRRLTMLANKGAPVGSGTSTALSRYLFQFEAENINNLPEEKVVSSFGWVEGPQKTFVLGNEVLSESSAPLVHFRAKGPGDNQLASGFRQSGTYTGWLDAVTPAMKYPRPALGVYAALATPFLKIFEADSFGIDFSCRTSTGKTTTLRIAGSTTGNPNERARESIVQGWDTTRNALESRCELNNDIAVIMDDSKRLDIRHAGQMIYTAINGSGRGRGSKYGGLQETRN